MKTASLDSRIEMLQAFKLACIEVIDERLGGLLEERNTRWQRMPINTLANAKKAELQRLRDCLSNHAPRHLNEMVAKELDCVVARRDPPQLSPKHEPKVRTWYNAKSDIEWAYMDMGDRHESDYRWGHGTTNASRFSPIRKYQRTRLGYESN